MFHVRWIPVPFFSLNVCACLAPILVWGDHFQTMFWLQMGPLKSPFLSFSPHPPNRPPIDLPPILSTTITFSSALFCFQNISSNSRPPTPPPPLLSWQITAIPDRPWGTFGVFYTLTLQARILRFPVLDPCDSSGMKKKTQGVERDPTLLGLRQIYKFI